MKDLIKEKELLEKAKESNLGFDELYKYFVNDVYRFSYSILNNQHDAEDITSKVFTELYKKIDKYEWQGISMKSWLFKAARNICYKKFRGPVLEEFDENFDADLNDEISFVDQIMNLELIEEVKKEIENLNPIEKEIITLRIWEGLQFKEIALMNDSSEDTTKKRFYRSIEKVKKALESKGLKSLIALPFLYTAIKQVGSTPAYAAPITLTLNTFNKTTFNKINMENINNTSSFFASKAGIALAGLAISAVAITAIGGTLYAKSRNNNSKNNTALVTTPAPTPKATVTPTSTPTSQATVEPTIQNNANKYVYDYLGIEFSYPKDWTVEETQSKFKIDDCESGNNAQFYSKDYCTQHQEEFLKVLTIKGPNSYSPDLNDAPYIDLSFNLTSGLICAADPNTYDKCIRNQERDVYIIDETLKIHTNGLSSQPIQTGPLSEVKAFVISTNLGIDYDKDDVLSQIFGSMEYITATPTKKVEATVTPATFLTYKDKDFQFEFEYPAQFSVNTIEGYKEESTPNSFSKKLEVVDKSTNTSLNIVIMTPEPIACKWNLDTTPELVGSVFKLESTNEIMARYVTLSGSISYTGYSSEVNGEGYRLPGCVYDISFHDKKFVILLNISSNTNTDLGKFDTIVASMRYVQ